MGDRATVGPDAAKFCNPRKNAAIQPVTAAPRACEPRRSACGTVHALPRLSDSTAGDGIDMLYMALMFLVVALVAGVLGLTGIAGLSANIAWILFVVGLILAIVSFVFGRRGRI
jgi:uncharacterized membrane protein YtjA (UPF0391 family)